MVKEIKTDFNGQIFQVIEALDWGDAVSNQVIALDSMFQELGFSSGIYAKSHHINVHNLCSDLEDLQVTDKDIVILHYVGYSGYVLPYVKNLRCTKVFVYHNITPHTFFQSETPLYELCYEGRQQLGEDVVENFHYFWGDSSYNLEELLQLGVDPKNCSVVPIIVPIPEVEAESPLHFELKNWLFVGRIAPNKGQVSLVELFSKIRSKANNIANKLYLVGRYQVNDLYYQELIQKIKFLALEEHVVLTGKVSDDKLESYFHDASIYVSMSQHEGFGVPLIEATHRGLPVVALRNTAIPETMGNSPGLANSPEELENIIIDILHNSEHLNTLIKEQKHNAIRFTHQNVEERLVEALEKILPVRQQFSTVSIVICTFNRAELLERCLDYLKYQTNQNFEVVVINGPSTDHTSQIIDKHKDHIKFATNPQANLSMSRNMGIELSDGDLIAFIDDDALPFDDWIETLLREFNKRPLTLAALGGPVYYAGTLDFQAEDIGINSLAETEVNIDSGKIGREGWERSLLGTNTCFRADVLREVQGYDEEFDYFLDESELCFRLQKLNYIVGYCNNLFVRHEFAQSENRVSKYSYNWFSICKNTAYFIATYSGIQENELLDFISNKIQKDRLEPLRIAYHSGEITTQDYKYFEEKIVAGMKQGLSDAQSYPQTRFLQEPPNLFRQFASPPSFPIVGRDLKSLHICIITKEFPPFAGRGGIGTLYYHLASELLLMGHYVTVIVPANSNTPPHQQIYRRGRFSLRYAKYHSICSGPLRKSSFANNVNWSISAFHETARAHAERSIDILDSALWDTEALSFALVDQSCRPPLVLRLVTPFPVAARLNNWKLPETEIEFLKGAEETLIKNAEAVIPISESIATTVEKEYSLHRDSRWRTSYCGIAYWSSFDCSHNYSEFPQISSVDGKTIAVTPNLKIILFVGRLEKRKGIDLLLAAANQFLLSDPHTYLLLAGRDVEGWINISKTLLSQDLLQRVYFLGEVDDLTREKLLHISYCLVFPSRYESFGLVPLEAFVHGVPVIASSSGAIPEVVRNNYCGLLFPPENIDALANCITRLLVNPKLHEELSKNSKGQIRKFSSRKSAIKTLRIYEKLIKR
jgi:glycosyltransferase involved in cell wall biosynthesis